MDTEKRQRGRPFKPDEERRTAELRIRLTDDERELLDAAADGKTSTWAREIILAEAQELLSKQIAQTVSQKRRKT